MYRSIAACIAVACLVLSRSLESNGQEQADPQLECIRDRVQRQSNRLHSICFILKSWPGTDSPSGPPENTRVLAAMGDRRYEEFWHGDRRTREDDPRSLTRFYDGSHFNVFKHYRRRYETANTVVRSIHVDKVRTNMLFECLGWWPPEDPNSPPLVNGQPHYLKHILEDPRLRLAGRDDIDGNPVAIIEIPSVVQLWIDEEHGFIRRRVQLQHVNGADVVRAQFEMSEFAAYQQDVWLPAVIIRRFPRMSVSDTFHRCEFVSVNSVDTSLFSFDPPPGTLIYNRDTDETSQVPGGLDYLEAISRRTISLSQASKVDSPYATTWDVGVAFLSFFTSLSLVKAFAKRRVPIAAGDSSTR